MEECLPAACLPAGYLVLVICDLTSIRHPVTSYIVRTVNRIEKK